MVRLSIPAAVLTTALLALAPSAPADTPSAKDIFATAFKNTQAASSFRVKVAIEVTLGEGMTPMGISAEGWMKSPDLNYVKMNGFGGMETESYHKGPKGVRKDAVTGEWVSEDGEEGDLTGQKLQNPLEYVKLVEPYADKAELLADETIEEGKEKVLCSVVKLTPPAEAFRGLLSGNGIPEAAVDWSKAKVVLRGWIAKDTMLFRQLIADLDLQIAGLAMPGSEGDDELMGEEPAGKKGKHHKDKGHKKGEKDPAPGAAPAGDSPGAKPDPSAGDPMGGGEKPAAQPGADGGDEDGGAGAPVMKVSPKAKFSMYDYDQDPSADIPAVVKTKLGIK
ncbi:MAG: hypothetical protein HYZ53_19395 [Planctomycetes bacterium]|nr:hypothetical protein [Planctomycetota bacterium]